MTLAATASGADLPLREHVLRTVRLAGPVMLARAGLLISILDRMAAVVAG